MALSLAAVFFFLMGEGPAVSLFANQDFVPGLEREAFREFVHPWGEPNAVVAILLGITIRLIHFSCRCILVRDRQGWRSHSCEPFRAAEQIPRALRASWRKRSARFTGSSEWHLRREGRYTSL